MAEKIDEWSTGADVSAFRRSIGLFFFYYFFYNRLRTLYLRFLLWMYLASILLERFRSARQKAITSFAALLAESSLREELACGPVIKLLHRSCNCVKLAERAARFPARASCAGSKVGAEKFAWACNPTRYDCFTVCCGNCLVLTDWPGLFTCRHLSYQVGLQAQAIFSARTFEPAHEARAGKRAALSVNLSQLQLRCSNSITGPQASSSRSELSAKWAAKNVIAFCRADRNISSKILARYIQSKKRKSFLDDRRKKDSLIDLRKALASASVDRSSILSAAFAAGLFPNISSKILARYIQSKKRKYKVLRRS